MDCKEVYTHTHRQTDQQTLSQKQICLLKILKSEQKITARKSEIIALHYPSTTKVQYYSVVVEYLRYSKRQIFRMYFFRKVINFT